MAGATRTAFVTGATGFLGLNLVEQLLRAGWAVTALHRPNSDVSLLRGRAVTLAQGDILDRAWLTQAMPRAVDAVFHVAADTSVSSRSDERQTRVNVEGTRNVLAAAKARAAKRFVHTSTWNVYAPEMQSEIREDSPKLGARSWINYNRSKYQAEMAVLEAAAEGMQAVVLNPGHIIGRYDRHGWARLIAAAARRGLPGVPPGFGSFCHARAVARAHIAATERGESGRNYLLGGADASFVDLVRTVGVVTGRRVNAWSLPAPLFKAAARTNVLWAGLTRREPMLTPEAAALVCARARIASTRARDELGYRPAALGGMVEDCCAWLRAQGIL